MFNEVDTVKKFKNLELVAFRHIYCFRSVNFIDTTSN